MEEILILAKIHDGLGVKIKIPACSLEYDSMFVNVSFETLSDKNESVFLEQAQSYLVKEGILPVTDTNAYQFALIKYADKKIDEIWQVELLPKGQWLMSRVRQPFHDLFESTKWSVKFDNDGSRTLEKKETSELEKKELEFVQSKVNLVNDIRKKYGV